MSAAVLQVNTKLRCLDGLLTEITGQANGKWTVRCFIEPLTTDQVNYYFRVITEKEYQEGMAKIAAPGAVK